jgi:transcriptional regulator with XRE-family HTH domain
MSSSSPLPKHGHYIRELREARGMSIRRAAQRVDLSDSYWSQIERGLKEPSRRTLVSVAEALDLSPAERDELLAMAGHKPVGTDQARRRLEEVADLLALSPSARARLFEAAGLPPAGRP